jgi:hypothetical protein
LPDGAYADVIESLRGFNRDIAVDDIVEDFLNCAFSRIAVSAAGEAAHLG